MMTVEDIMNKYNCHVEQYLYMQAPKFNKTLCEGGYFYIVVEARNVKGLADYMTAKYNVIAFKSKQDSDSYCAEVGDSAVTKQYVVQDGIVYYTEN